METYAAGGEESSIAASPRWVISSLCFRFALWIASNYDRRAYIETEELRCSGDIFLQNFCLCPSRGTNGRVSFPRL